MTSLPGMLKRFDRGEYRFRTPENRDADLLHGWVHQPHAADWWTPAQEDLVDLKTGNKERQEGFQHFIVSHGGRDFAYIQCYDPSARPEKWEGHVPPAGTVCIAQFIGDPEMIGFGHGSKFIQAFIEEAKNIPGITRIVAAPHPENVHGIRCFKQVGFRQEKEIGTPEGSVLLMSLNVG